MIGCPSCGATNAQGVPACARCGTSLGGTEASPGGPAQDLADETILKNLEDAQRLKRRRMTHALTGAATFFLVNLLTGLPGSLGPGTLVLNAITSLGFGLPIGYIISRMGGGVVRGAAISGATFICARLVLAVPALVRGEGGFEVLLPAILWGIMGVIPGALIGMHVETDN